MKKTVQNYQAFTLLELLVVIAVIGILAAIAIPQYTSYRQRAFDTRAENDVRSIAMAEEAYFSENEVYKSCDSIGMFSGSSCAGALPGFNAHSDGVLAAVISTATGFIVLGYHPNGTFDDNPVGKSTFFWNSSLGGPWDGMGFNEPP